MFPLSKRPAFSLVVFCNAGVVAHDRRIGVKIVLLTDQWQRGIPSRSRIILLFLSLVTFLKLPPYTLAGSHDPKLQSPWWQAETIRVARFFLINIPKNV
jgi:hypothetical protein